MAPESQTWLDYRAKQATASSSIVGDLRVLPDVPGPGPGVRRDILVHVPAGAFEGERRYPVLYMLDGQNLFDAATSYSGEWGVDATLATLSGEGLELIVVGVPNAGDRRSFEYTPYPWRAGSGIQGAGGGARAFLRYLVETVKPLVDAAFPTLDDRSATGIMGSSAGATLSLWACVQEGTTFGLIGAMSPALQAGQAAMLRHLRHLPLLPDRVYIDVGLAERAEFASDPALRPWRKAFPTDARRARAAFLAAGLTEPDRLRYLEEPAAIHHETAWGRRLPDALRFLFGR